MTSVPSFAPVMEAHVDWLSMSADAPSGISALLSYRDRTVRRLEDEGWQVKPWGTHGWRGIRTEGLRFGSTGSSILVQLSGERARRDWREVARYASNISRLDLACTVGPLSDASSLARDGYRAVSGPTRRTGRPIGYSLLQTTQHSDTLYIGSRASDAFGRLYDKGAETKSAAYKGCWRYEVEYKRRAAYSKAKAILAAKDEAKAIQGDCHRWFATRGIAPCYAPGGLVGDSVDTKALADDERWLVWVRRSVQPRARELVARYGWRFVAEACAGRIQTVEQYLSLARDLEFELETKDLG